MKIKEYLNILDRLPLSYGNSITMTIPVLNDFNLKSDGDFLKYNVIEFKESSYRDHTNKIKHKWVMTSNIKIDYKVDEIYMTCSSDLIFYTLIDLCQQFKFDSDIYNRNLNRRFFYINFKVKYWCYSNISVSGKDPYFIDDDLILKNIFYESINEYPNGIPIIWED